MSWSPYVKSLQSFYNSIGEKYNGPMASFHRETAEKLVEAAGPSIKEGSWVLDLATGTGNVAFEAAKRVGPTGRVLGVDISDEFLRIASQAAKELGVAGYVEFIQRNVEDLALPEPYAGGKCFDAVTCGSAIAMFPDPSAVLDVVSKKLLKPGGVLVADMHGTHIPAKTFLDTSVPRGFQPPFDPSWLNDPASGLRKLLEGSDFDLKDVTTTKLSSQGSWDVGTDEAVEKQWKSIVVDSTWVSFGVDKLDPQTLDEVKKAWVGELQKLKGPGGSIVTEREQYIAVAVLKG